MKICCIQRYVRAGISICYNLISESNFSIILFKNMAIVLIHDLYRVTLKEYSNAISSIGAA
jgi:hypothetical protein